MNFSFFFVFGHNAFFCCFYIVIVVLHVNYDSKKKDFLFNLTLKSYVDDSGINSGYCRTKSLLSLS